MESSSRVALAALLHDLGKITERARIDYGQEAIEKSTHLYCPFHSDKGYHSHKHAAYSALAIDEITPLLPPIIGDAQNVYPFKAWNDKNVDDSLINAAAKHHKPDTFLQWIIAKADRLASGFERENFEQYNQAKEGTETGKNHYQARLLSLFEQININHQSPAKITPASLQYRMPLAPLNVQSIFPQKREAVEQDQDSKAQAEYGQLWQGLKQALGQIPASIKDHLPLWLESFDALLMHYAHAIPSATAFNARPDVSLYDHTKATAAIAVALWRYWHDTQADEKTILTQLNIRDIKLDQTPAFLLISGDFYGIQNFIFDEEESGNSQKKAAKLLRGRSFYVSALAELSALKILTALELPITSQITNAAGKFLILAPNTPQVQQKLTQLQTELDQWFLQNTFAQVGIGIATQPMSADDFALRRFSEVFAKLTQRLEAKKYQRFNLLEQDFPDYSHYLSQVKDQGGVCSIQGRYPADGKDGLAKITQDQIKLGELLAKADHNIILVYHRQPHFKNKDTLLDIFGYHLDVCTQKDMLDQIHSQAALKDISRIIDMSPATDPSAAVYNGLLRRNIKGYIPVLTQQDQTYPEKYKNLDESEQISLGQAKTLQHLACENRQPDPSNHQAWLGQCALHVLKGDVDNLGQIFQRGLQDGGQKQLTFAKMASLSRQIDQFFSLYLPYLLKSQYPNTYIVFAGGDDFFLIGPWKDQIHLVETLRKEFARYVAHNSQIHFSVGLSLNKAGIPIRQMANFAEERLEQAKKNLDSKGNLAKNAVHLFGYSLSASEFEQLLANAKDLLKFKNPHYQSALSTGFVYDLLSLADMAANKDQNPQNHLWRSKLLYRINRLLKDEDPQEKQLKDTLIPLLGNALNQYKDKFKVSLFYVLYNQRR